MKNKKLHILLCLGLFGMAVFVYLNRYFTEFGTTIFSFSVATSLSLLPLYFLREEIFTAWWRFAKWYLGILGTFFLFIFTFGHERGGGFGGPQIGGDLESNIMFFAVLFFLISLGIIIMKWRKLRGK